MDKIVHMIGNAHIDPVWLWCLPDGYTEVRATFRSALDRMKETEEFIFTSAAAIYYEWVEKTDPGMFEEIRARVKEGRWQLAGGWLIQPDCNIPSGESFARQALYAQRYFYEKFGVTCRTGYNVDSFGHTGALPKILRASGMERYVFMRPGPHEKALPSSLFRWESENGESVTAYRLPRAYCAWGHELAEHIAKSMSEAITPGAMMCFYGVGNHGGGPTRENIQSIMDLRAQGAKLVFSSPDAFFDAEPAPAATVRGDLLHHASGCYSAHSAVKRKNREAENLLISAEKWMSVARARIGRAASPETLKAAWKKLLFNQFHDIMAGTCIQEAYEDALDDLGYAASAAKEEMNEALQALAANIDVPFEEGAQPVIVFNPHGFEAEAPVRLETKTIPEDMALEDENGESVPFQACAPSAAAYGRAAASFVAKVPPMGWRAYRLVRRAPSRASIPEGLENEWIRAELGGDSCGLTHLIWKPTGEDLLASPMRARVIRDESDTWSHAVFSFQDEIGEMRLESAKVVERGPVFATVRTVSRWGESALTQDFTVYQGLPYVHVRAKVDWRETQKALKICVPTRFTGGIARAQAPYGFAERPENGVEHPMQQWASIDDGIMGLALLNDGKYSFDAKDGALELTALRSPYYANHEPFVATPDMDKPVIDRGEQVFCYRILPHAADIAYVDRQAMLLGAPVEARAESFHPGALPARASNMALEGGTAVIDCAKTAEDGRGLVIHMHENAMKRAECALRLPSGRALPLSFAPGEIQAWYLPYGEEEPARRVNLLEFPMNIREK